MLTKTEKENRVCAAPDCHVEAYSKGYCNKHYNQVRIHGKLTPDIERIQYTAETNTCTECGGRVVAKGLCMTHYQAIRRASLMQDQVETAVAHEPIRRRRVVRRRANG